MKYGLLLLIFLVGCGNQNQTNMKWLEGTWRHTNLDYPAFERWEVENPKLITGCGFQIEPSGDTTIVERFKIFENDGKIYYQMQVEDRELTLPLVLRGDSTLIFESRDNDFPQRLCYTKTSDTSIDCTLSGVLEGEQKVFEFKMKKE